MQVNSKPRTIQQTFSVSYDYPVIFSNDCFNPGNQTLVNVMAADNGTRPRVLVVIDRNVAMACAGLEQQISSYFQVNNLQLVSDTVKVTGGEVTKNDPTLLKMLYQLVADEAIDRHSFIMVVGGGAVIDAVGYAAATAHRGIRLIRMPTTVLAQNDAGIGVKNGVNFAGRKNFLGCFTPPFAVINDASLLSTLEERDKRAGIAEAVKVALIKDERFFNSLYEARHNLAAFESQAMSDMIFRCAELHLEHIRSNGDPFELGSARPLDFGHWSAHKLEALSGYAIRHGEAVAVGIALDLEYCKRIGLISEESCNKGQHLLRDLGFDLAPKELSMLDVSMALEEFREHIGGRLCITLIERLGKRVEVSEISIDEMKNAIRSLRANFK